MIQTLFGPVEQEPTLLEKLKSGVQKTRDGFVTRIEEVVSGKKKIDADLLEELEYTLISADIGVRTTQEILDRHGLRYSLEWKISGLPFYTPPGRLSSAVVGAIEQVCGLTPDLSTSGGTSDGRFIARMGAEVVEVGVVNASIHKIDEHVKLTDVDRLADIYLAILHRLNLQA